MDLVPSCSLEAQPVEILDQILGHVPNPSDLLALSFASTIVANVIVPRHLPSCCVDIQNISLLQKLLASPLRFQIFSLELVSRADVARINLYGNPVGLSLPGTEIAEITDPTGGPHQAVTLLLREIQNMRSFHWNVAGIPPSVDIFTALQSSAAALESVRIHSLRQYGHNDVVDKWFMQDSPLWRFSNLTSFSFAVSSLTSFYHAGQYIRQLVEMLGRFPLLEELELLLANDQPSDLRAIFLGRWPQLKKLSLGGPEIASSAAIPLSAKSDVQNFFAAHPLLEHLYLSINIRSGTRPVSYPWHEAKFPAASFGIVSLPNLQLLHVPQNIFAVISPEALMPKLKHIRWVEAERSYLPVFRQLALGFPNLTSIWLALHQSLALPDVKSYLSCLPSLEKLYVSNGAPDPWVPIVRMPDAFYLHPARDRRCRLARGAMVGDVDVPNPLASVLDALSVLPRLTHLPNFIMFHAHNGLDALVDPVVSQLAATLPRLAFLEIIITTICAENDTASDLLREGATWLAIERDEWSGAYIGWNIVQDEDRALLDLDFVGWGGLKWILHEHIPDDPFDLF
ncbi:hypothetical protein FB451DRAFT_1471104 [Mycena latifolia]|nr:hypothetical protein FB451DRAFT_1471104 [Mycena latifolia]